MTFLTAFLSEEKVILIDVVMPCKMVMSESCLLKYPNDGQVNVWYVIMQDIEA